jgi:hypothetical protein
MGKKKTKTQQTTTNTYGWQNRPETADTQAARSAIQNVDFSSPIFAQFGQAERDIDEMAFEPELNEEAKSKIKYGKMFNLRMNKGAALADAKSREEQFKTGNLMSMAGMTAPVMVQTGGTMNGTQTTSDPWGTAMGLIGGAGSVASGMGSMGVT